MNKTRIRTGQWTAAWLQAALTIGLPFYTVHGESALRFDIPSLQLFFFGSVLWISEASFFLLALIMFFLGIMLFTALYGRMWCRWMCPQAVLSRFNKRIIQFAERLAPHTAVSAFIPHIFTFLFSLFVSATLIWYFVSPYTIAQSLATASLGPWTFGSWIFIALLLYLDLAFTRRRFCGSHCPSVGLNRKKPRIAGLSLVFSLIVVAFTYQIFERVPVGFMVIHDENQPYHQSGFKGNLMNVYDVFIENRSLAPATYLLTVNGVKDAELLLSNNPFVVPEDTTLTARIYVVVKRKNLTERTTRLRFTLESTKTPEIRIIREAPFVYPERSDKGVEI